MRKSLSMLSLFGLPGLAAAHVADVPMLQHALEHGWLALLLVPLLLLLLPLRDRRG